MVPSQTPARGPTRVPEPQSHLIRSRSMVLLWSFWRPVANFVLQTSLGPRTRVANQKGENLFQSVQKDKIFGVSRVCIIQKKNQSDCGMARRERPKKLQRIRIATLQNRQGATMDSAVYASWKQSEADEAV